MKKKIKAIIFTIWFVLSIILSYVFCFIYQELLHIALLNLFVSLGLIIFDNELVDMELW